MDKNEFLAKLRERLNGFSEQEILKRLDYYAELISDMTEDGMSEQDAVEKLGGVDKVADDILREQPIGKLMRMRMRPKEGWTGLSIALVLMSTPVWMPVMLATFAVILSLLVALAAVVISLYAAVLALGVSAPAGVVAAVLHACSGDWTTAVFYIACAMLCAGLFLLSIKFANLFAKWALYAARAVAFALRSLFIKNGRDIENA